MREEILSPREALERGSHLPYALVRRLSGASLGPTPGEIPAEELLEERLLIYLEQLIGEDGEIRATQTHAAVEDGLLKVTLESECVEEIGREVPGRGEIPQEENSGTA